MKLATRIFKKTNWYVTSPFGYRYHPITGKYTFHNGCDYGTNVEKWAQYALEDGYVYLIGNSGTSGYGKYIWVRYPRLNISLLHAHLDSIKVKKGDEVHEGTLLGYTGKTGSATGIHLHLGMTKIGKSEWLNPDEYDYIPPEQTDIQYQAYDNKKKKWLGVITNYNIVNSNGYAGIKGNSIGGIRVKVKDGAKVTVKSHIKGGQWLSEITKWDDTATGYSGIKGKPIDKFMVKCEGHTVHYRAHVKGENWLSWITQYKENDPYGYAGVTGKEIDMIQMYVD